MFLPTLPIPALAAFLPTCGTAIILRDAALAGRLVAGRADAAILTSGSPWNRQFWGLCCPLAPGVLSASDAYHNGLTIGFLGRTSLSGDSVAPRGFTVVRWP
jgi:hypothetical protein